MANIKDFVSGLGLVITGLMLSSILQEYLPALQTFRS